MLSRIPKEARDGLMRAWIAILEERHPGTKWIDAEQQPPRPAGTKWIDAEQQPPRSAGSSTSGRPRLSRAETSDSAD